MCLNTSPVGALLYRVTVGTRVMFVFDSYSGQETHQNFLQVGSWRLLPCWTKRVSGMVTGRAQGNSCLPTCMALFQYLTSPLSCSGGYHWVPSVCQHSLSGIPLGHAKPEKHMPDHATDLAKSGAESSRLEEYPFLVFREQTRSFSILQGPLIQQMVVVLGELYCNI